jgi:hypothetical protein
MWTRTTARRNKNTEMSTSPFAAPTKWCELPRKGSCPAVCGASSLGPVTNRFAVSGAALPQELELELLIGSSTLVLDIESGISRDSELFACHLNGKWFARFDRIRKTTELRCELRSGVGPCQISIAHDLIAVDVTMMSLTPLGSAARPSGRGYFSICYPSPGANTSDKPA